MPSCKLRPIYVPTSDILAHFSVSKRRIGGAGEMRRKVGMVNAFKEMTREAADLGEKERKGGCSLRKMLRKVCAVMRCNSFFTASSADSELRSL